MGREGCEASVQGDLASPLKLPTPPCLLILTPIPQLLRGFPCIGGRLLKLRVDRASSLGPGSQATLCWSTGVEFRQYRRSMAVNLGGGKASPAAYFAPAKVRKENGGKENSE